MKKRHRYAILYIIWILIIFWFSAQITDDSQEVSDFFMCLLGAVFSLDIMRSEIIRSMIGFLVHKVTYMSEYAVLVILFGLTIRECEKEPWLLLTLVTTAACAATDEFHQLSVPSRSGQLKDILIDTVGGALRLGLPAFILYLKHTRKMKETGKLS